MGIPGKSSESKKKEVKTMETIINWSLFGVFIMAVAFIVFMYFKINH